jgi:hypothetical protein
MSVKCIVRSSHGTVMQAVFPVSTFRVILYSYEEPKHWAAITTKIWLSTHLSDQELLELEIDIAVHNLSLLEECKNDKYISAPGIS